MSFPEFIFRAYSFLNLYKKLISSVPTFPERIRC